MFIDTGAFIAMKDKKIKDAFAFDRHFRMAGFNILPGYS